MSHVDIDKLKKNMETGVHSSGSCVRKIKDTGT